ncbi:protein of uncharacterised function (DUF1707) [Mycobacterium tuberculosis]|nr:protein of uncharacterised function (DUF1707) [Mycobacterium tuberculosis]
MSNSAQRDARNSRDESARASDTDRIQIAQLLAYAAEQGRLQLTDYEDRLARAYAAPPTRSWIGCGPICRGRR